MAMSLPVALVVIVMVYFATLTVKFNGCCRASDNNNSVVQGHWYDLKGMKLVATQMNTLQKTIITVSLPELVRLYCNGNPPERGRFYCEIPNASA